ncbi:MAG: hypothetical protein AB8G96_02755 [Phycisphaerales bacterium]
MDRAALGSLLLQLAGTGGMVGVIWFVQMVHYPLFAEVPEAGFQAYEQAHVRRTGTLVGPLMLMELAAAIWLLVRTPIGVPEWMPWAGLVVLALLWGSTFFVQVPLHRQLEAGFNLEAIERLVATNWLRTVGWTLRGGLAVWMLLRAVDGIDR